MYKRQVLPGFDYSAEQLATIVELIAATKMPQRPTSPLAELLCDADLDVLGREDFWPINRQLLDETQHYQGRCIDEAEWLEGQTRFLAEHQDVYKRQAMMSDAISHTVLLGIVLGFLVIGSLESPLLMAAAAAVGVLTVSLVELLLRTKLVRQDAAIGLVFPALFSVAVILISRFARGVHLDVDAVLLGELTFAPLDRISVVGLDLPRSLVVMSIILLLNVAFIALRCV